MSASFDVVVPTWNRRALLAETLASALAQTVPVRVAVVDNASDDGTEEEVRARFGDRVEYHRFTRHVPYQENLTRCLGLLRADVGLVLHDDDLIDPEYGEVMLDAFARHPEAGVVIAGARPFQSPGSRFRMARIRSPFAWMSRMGLRGRDGVLCLPAGRLAEELVRHVRLCPFWPSLCFRRETLRSVGAFRSDLGTLLDYEAWIRVTARTAVVLLERKVCSFRFHASNMSNRLIWPHTRNFEHDVLTMHGRLAELLGYVPSEELSVRFLAKVLLPVVLLGPRERRAQYDRFLAHSGYSFERLMHEQTREMNEFWWVKGWPPVLAQAAWRAYRTVNRLQRVARRGDA